MACGCKGGTWTPPTEQAPAATASGRPAAPQPVKTAGLVGPAAPGYFHGPDR